MNIYQIDADIRALIDEDTGEISDYDALTALLAARDNKIESAGLIFKQFAADATALKAEIDALTERKCTADRNAERLKAYLTEALAGQTFETPKVKVSYRKSSAVEIADESKFIAWAMKNREDVLVYEAPHISKTAVSNAIKGGAELPGAKIVTKNNINIK